MRVAINARFLNQPVTGVQRYARTFIEHLDDATEFWGDMTFSLVAPKLSGPRPKFKNLQIVEHGKLTGQLWEQLELPFYNDYDLLFCLGNSAPAIPLLLGRQVATVIHDLAYREHPAAYSAHFRAAYAAITPLVMNRAAAVVTVSDTARETILAHYPGVAERLHVVSNGGAPLNGPIDPTSPFNRPYVLYVGTLSKLKNFPAARSVAERLLADCPDYLFVFVGDRSNILKGFNPDFGVEDSRMVFVGQIDQFDTLARYYAHAEALVFPSLSESSGLPPVEAMSFGCPVVASNIPGLVERCGEAALYCDPHDPNDIYLKLRKVLKDSNLRAALIREGLLRAKRYTWAACVIATLKVLGNTRQSTI